MIRKAKVKVKKHQILGGIKVSSSQLSEWGKSGGRPKQWASEAERKRAERLRKKQEKFGEKAELRPYYFEKEKPKEIIKSSLLMICNKCCAEVISGPQRLGGSCYRVFCEGRLGVK